MTFDELRARFPNVGLALYAIEPGGPVTLEIISPDGSVFPFEADTAAAAIEAAFPPEPQPAAESNIFD